MKKENNSGKIELITSSNIEHHKCKAFRNGDWIIHRCPKCDFELRDNWRTGELIARNTKAEIKHSSNYFSNEYKEAFVNIN